MIYQNFLKPLIDLLTAVILVVLLFPLFLVISLLIYIKLGRPIFFLQERAGYQGKIFKIIKFRTMLNSRSESNELLPDIDRLTVFGKFLRRFSLDELPSLFNVIKGDISFIGPRPFIAEYLEYYNEFQMQRHEVKPGITGWAQVCGRNAITWEEKFELDIWYVQHRSFWFDLKILILTFIRLLKPVNISNPEHVTMPKFLGSDIGKAKLD